MFRFPLAQVLLGLLFLCPAWASDPSAEDWIRRVNLQVAAADADRLNGNEARAVDGYLAAIDLAEMHDNEASRELRAGFWFRIGILHRTAFRYGAAMVAFARTEALAGSEADRFEAIRHQALVGAFLEPSVALSAVDRALTLVDQVSDPERTRGHLLDLRGRALLNAGRPHEASEALQDAVEHLGGLRPAASPIQLSARADSAAAAAMEGEMSAAYRFLAYAGAQKFGLHNLPDGHTPPPQCGDDGVRPDDWAIIEFSLAENGKVADVLPIYLSRPGPHAAAFAHSVATWAWPGEKVREIHPALRATLRAELRCAERRVGGGRLQPLFDEAQRWFSDQGVSTAVGTDASPRRLDDLQARLNEVGHTAALERAPILMAMAMSASPNLAARNSAGAEFRSIVDAFSPPPVITGLSQFFGLWSLTRFEDGRVRSLSMDHRLAQSMINGATLGPEATEVIKLLIADAYLKGAQPEKARLLVDSLLSDPSVKGYTRLAAQFTSAVTAHVMKDPGRAFTDLAATGIDGAYCLMLGSDPLTAKEGGNAFDAYPRAAAEWLLEGWVDVEFAVDSDGSVTRVRTLVAMPPLVFGRAAEAQIARRRFKPLSASPSHPGCHIYRVPVAFTTGRRPAR